MTTFIPACNEVAKKRWACYEQHIDVCSQGAYLVEHTDTWMEGRVGTRRKRSTPQRLLLGFLSATVPYGSIWVFLTFNLHHIVSILNFQKLWKTISLKGTAALLEHVSL